jgi:cation-transporting ATPase 13A2
MTSPRIGRRRESRRSHVASSVQDGYFALRDGYTGRGRPSGDVERERDEAEESQVSTSPARPSTALGKLASYIGFARSEAGDEEAALPRRSSSRSMSRSRRGSFDSERRSRSPSPSSSGWGLSDEDDEEYSDRPEGEEGYTSSLADDTSLPPQSRPGSPTLPLVPNPGDGIFGEPSTRHEFAEPKDFASVTVPSRQTILLPDEDLSIRFTCYRTDPLRNVLWWAGCILTLGALGLLGRWIPSIWVRFCGKETPFDDAKDGAWLVVEVSLPCKRDARPHLADGSVDTLWRSPHHSSPSRPIPLPPLHSLPSSCSSGGFHLFPRRVYPRPATGSAATSGHVQRIPNRAAAARPSGPACRRRRCGKGPAA